MKLYLPMAILLATLAGCQTAPQREPKIQTVYTNVEVPVSCVQSKVDKPALISDAELKALPEGKFVLALWADRLLRRDYEAKVEAVLSACEGVNK